MILKIKDNRKQFALASFAIYLFSLGQDAFVYIDVDVLKNYSSTSVLFMGGLAILGGGLCEFIIWLANPFYFIALLLLWLNNKVSVIIALISFLISLSFVMWSHILVSENGRMGTIQHLKSGYWFWCLSIFVLYLSANRHFKNHSQQKL
jgi:hypothetical protein